MSTYTLEQVESAAEILEQDQNAPSWMRLSEMLYGYAALLRERESAKAGVTDAVVERAVDARIEIISRKGRINVSDNAAMRAALEAVAPMLVSARVPVEKENVRHDHRRTADEV